MKLYHFTSTHHWPAIIAAEFLKTTESNIGSVNELWKPFGEHVGPDVVWLTDMPEITAKGCGLNGSRLDKTEIRITVEVADAISWPAFAAKHGINKKWYRALGSGRRPETWWVVPRRIYRVEWIDVVTVLPDSPDSAHRAARSCVLGVSSGNRATVTKAPC